MRIFVAPGVIFEGRRAEREIADLWLLNYRRMCYQLRLTRDAGNFGCIVKWEQNVDSREWTDWFFVEGRGCDPVALDRYLRAEKRFVLERTEQCYWCWYGSAAMSDEVRDAPGSNIWTKEEAEWRESRRAAHARSLLC